jgi:hypothetical protein
VNQAGPQLVVCGLERPEAWRPDWAPISDCVSERPWRVEYDCHVTAESPPIVVDLHTAHVRLASVLDDAILFAKRNRIPLVADLSKAKIALSAARPSIPLYPDVLPPSRYSIEAKRLFACAAHAWVFGGSGSWSDVVLKPVAHAEYRQRTRDLLSSVVYAIEAAVNSGMPSTTGRTRSAQDLW